MATCGPLALSLGAGFPEPALEVLYFLLCALTSALCFGVLAGELGEGLD